MHGKVRETHIFTEVNESAENGFLYSCQKEAYY